MRVRSFLLTLFWSGLGVNGTSIYGINEVRRSVVAFREELLGFFRREYPWGYPGGGLCALRIVIGSGEAQIGASRVLRDASVPFAAGVLHRWEWLQPVH